MSWSFYFLTANFEMTFPNSKISSLTAWNKSGFLLSIHFTRTRAQALFSRFLFDRNITISAGINFIWLKIILGKQFSNTIQQTSFSFIRFANFTDCFPIYLNMIKVFLCFYYSSGLINFNGNSINLPNRKIMII